jgi:hypothetical protein
MNCLGMADLLGKAFGTEGRDERAEAAAPASDREMVPGSTKGAADNSIAGADRSVRPKAMILNIFCSRFI